MRTSDALTTVIDHLEESENNCDGAKGKAIISLSVTSNTATIEL